MISRKEFLKRSAFTTGALTVAPYTSIHYSAKKDFTSNRPAIDDRNFVSEAVEATIKELQGAIKDEELAWMFEGCFPNTLDTTVRHGLIDGELDTFVITGDIPAMWLRDSTAQVWPYIPLAVDDKPLKDLLKGVVNRHTKCILIDPYANAFNFDDNPDHSSWESDNTAMKPELHERKWEIDSLCYAIRLAHGYWKVTGDASIFDERWQQAMKVVVQTFKEQQRKEGNGPYRFLRVTDRFYDNLPYYGYGNPTKKVGLIHSMFRPSDDACLYPFLVPSNLFAVTSLRNLIEIYEAELSDSSFVQQCAELADEVEEAVKEYAKTEHLNYGDIYAYEVDGFGNQFFADDANIPSLLSLPYLGACDVTDPLYQQTRAFVLSDDNPNFYRGTHAEGIGGPHIGTDMVWPMSITMRALTSQDENEIKKCISMLRNTHGDTGFMHESFHKDDPARFTRSWFAWANTLFGEMILKTDKDHPGLIRDTTY